MIKTLRKLEIEENCLSLTMGTYTVYICPDWCGSVGWASSGKAKGHQFNSGSGHKHGLWARSPVGECGKGNRSMSVSLSVKSISMSSGEDKKHTNVKGTIYKKTNGYIELFKANIVRLNCWDYNVCRNDIRDCNSINYGEG